MRLPAWLQNRTAVEAAPPPRDLAHRLETGRGVILYMEDVSVSFDGFKALNNLSLYIDEGELRCIIGPNGAGKSTMMDVITGKTRPDTGSVWFGQTLDCLRREPWEIAAAGVGRKFQKPTVFEQLSVLENLEVAMQADKRVRISLFARPTPAQRQQLDEVLTLIGLSGERDRLAGLISHGQKQWLEIGMLLMQNPRVLLVDEPVAGMTPGEVERTAELLNALAGKHSVIVVEHDMAFVRAIARKVTVLHQGSVLAEGNMDQVQADPRVQEVYLGEVVA
ncbi:MAG: urea ABC transporter ATP-binding protein UrtD [Candidatus Macondimonas sp.]|jgi:urea transport system ATP-binding protein